MSARTQSRQLVLFDTSVCSLTVKWTSRPHRKTTQMRFLHLRRLRQIRRQLERDVTATCLSCRNLAARLRQRRTRGTTVFIYCSTAACYEFCCSAGVGHRPVGHATMSLKRWSTCIGCRSRDRDASSPSFDSMRERADDQLFGKITTNTQHVL